MQALSKGLNYAVTPRTIPIEHIICQTETAISHLPINDAENIRQDIAKIIRKARPPTSNISYPERQALKDLYKDENLVVLPADKGNATVILNRQSYDEKIHDLLNSSDYKQVSNDPTTYLEKTTKSIIKRSQIQSEIQTRLIPREKSSRIPKIYGLPKIHKPNIPLRPIVSAYNCPTQPLAKYLAQKLQPLAEQAKSYVKNSYHFLELLKQRSLQTTEILVSFDIISLFTNIPINETLSILQSKHHVSPDDITLINHCMNNTYFTFQGKFYRQVKGAPMGSPLSPVIANIFMENFESIALSSSALKPSCWLRYVDDTFVIWPHGADTLNAFLSHLNSIHPSIQFTMEVENNYSLPFLDILVKKNSSPQGFTHTVYRKPTHTNRYLNANSHHHPAQLNSVVNSLVSRSLRLTDDISRSTELISLTETLIQNGYNKKHISSSIRRLQNPTPPTTPEPTETSKVFLPYIKGVTDKMSNIFKAQNIKTVFTTQQKLSNLVRSVKDIIPNENQGVYEIPCSDCPRTYIGQTNRRIFNRAYEHSLSVRNQDTSSALANHHMETGHTIDFTKTSTIAPIPFLQSRIIREAIEIEKRPHCLNKRDDGTRLPPSWKPVISKCVPPISSPPVPLPEVPARSRHAPSTTAPIRRSLRQKPDQSNLRSRQIETSGETTDANKGVGRLRPLSRIRYPS